MKAPFYIILDFDGTIADTLDLALGIYNRIAPEYGCRPAGIAERELFSNRKTRELLMTFGISRLKLLTLLMRIRKEMSKHIQEMKPVSGMENSLLAIRNTGVRMGILTSNSVDNVRIFLDLNNLSELFDFIYSGKSFLGKAKLIRKLILEEHLDAHRIIYAGDETRDIEASKAAGIPVIAVTWGFCRREVLSSLSPDQIADKPEELPACISRILNDGIDG